MRMFSLIRLRWLRNVKIDTAVTPSKNGVRIL